MRPPKQALLDDNQPKRPTTTPPKKTHTGILFSAVAETPYAHAWHDWVRLALSTLGTMIALRNLLVSMYEMTMDNTAPYPLLNPTLLSRIRR